MNCRVCGANTKKFLDLGKQPIANQFVKEIDDTETFYHLEIFFCPKCYSVQIGECPEASKVFTEDYPFYTSSSKFMQRHFEELSVSIKNSSIYQNNPFIVEIGSNDGTFLNFFKGTKHLGIEPCSCVADVAIKSGVNVRKEFFNEDCAAKVLVNEGEAGVIVSANTFSQIQDRKSVLLGIKKLLSNNGVWINEEPYLGNIIYDVAYDQFYNEHVFYSSIASYDKITKMFGLEVVGFKWQDVHGGSMRYYISHEGSNPKGRKLVEKALERESLSTFDEFKDFQSKVQESARQLKNKLIDLQQKKETIVGYGATAKSSTILNYCKIDGAIIKGIYDTTPVKQDTYSPGMHIPIIAYDTFKKDNNKNVVLFAWNHKKEILEKEKRSKINWILPV